jgi:hypothetical protein
MNIISRLVPGALLLLLAGCGSVTVSLTVHNRTDRPVPVELARETDGALGSALQLGKMLPQGRVKATFEADPGERFVVYADQQVLGERRITGDDEDPLAWELEVR